jgi:dTDP-glucose pyrophosphorylase
MNWQQHVIPSFSTIKEALGKLDILGQDALLFIHDSSGELIGSITDGDIRRGLLAGYSIDASVAEVSQKNPRFIRENEKSVHKLIEFREKNLKIVPVLAADSNRIIDVINFRLKHSLLPVDAVIMAGGEGQRLRPLTETTPKPLLKVGDKPIIEHTIDRLAYFGLKNLWLSVNYLAEQIEQFVIDKPKDISIRLVKETRPLGTIGSISLIDTFYNDYILLCNSDLLTNVDFEAFFLDFVDTNADLSVVTIPYNVDIPYAVLEVENGLISDFKEKPTYTYYSNGGIYLMKREMLQYIPKNEVFSATDFMSKLIEQKKSVRSYPHFGYWLDIGKHEDYKKAQEDILNLNFY